MRSVSAKVLAWSVAALLLSLAAFMFISEQVMGRWVRDSFARVNELQLYHARTAYETGGSKQLGQYLGDLKRFLHSDYYLTNASGMDLVTGENRAGMMAAMKGQRFAAWKNGERVVFGNITADKRYGWFVAAVPPFSFLPLLPFYLLLLAVVVVLYWLLATRIASPLRHLATVVESFGQGDLTARAPGKRKDEIGELGRSFNRMAERIQTLLVAERQLLQDVSHELRSPLARLTFAAEMVRKTPDRDAAAARLRSEIDRLSELVKTLLDMTRAEGDPTTVQMADVSLNDIVRSVENDCQVEASARGCSISSNGDQVRVRGDRELLRRAIENVVRNAIRYAPEASTINIALEKQLASVTLAVRDHGPGIPEELLPKIFTPFFRVDPSRTDGSGGVGLGLSIARRAVQLHHGDITASNANPGLLVAITLPTN